MEEKRDQLVFTFQYVSINTEVHNYGYYTTYNFTFQYVSINTRSVASEDLQARIFTFQYVSINTKGNESPP